MSKAFPLLLITCFSSMAVYYFLAVKLHLPDTAGMTAGILTAVLLSLFFARQKNKKRR